MTPGAVWATVNACANVKTMTGVVAAVAAWQLFLSARFWIRLRRERSLQKPSYAPPVSIIISCKGASRHFERNMRAFLAQEYPGSFEFLFVSPRTTDSAYRALETLLPGHDAVSWKLLCSDARPVRCCEKVMNMLFALERAKADSEVIVFADCDIRVPEGWLRNLVGRLEDPGVAAATNMPVYLAHEASASQFLRMLWTTLLISYTATFPQVFCPSWTIRRREFEALGIPALWLASAIDDLVVNAALRKADRRVELALQTIPVCWEDCDPAALLAWFTKGFRWCRVYAFQVWLLGALGILGKLYLWFWFLRTGHHAPLAGMIAGDMVSMALVFEAYRRFAPEPLADLHPVFRLHPLLAGLAAPLLPFLQLPGLLNSAISRDLHWSGYTYRMRAPQDVEVVNAA